tara:strand:+ start:528 stop:1040 length:513 start_codon:yes stop_codon:yes gene_type:complete
MGYTPYKMKGHTLKGIKQRGVPFTGGVGSNEMESGVADTINASPNKGLFGNIFKGAKKLVKKVGGKVGGALGLGEDTKALEGRVSALEASASEATSGDAGVASLPDDKSQALKQMMEKSKLSNVNPFGGGGGDPMLASAGMSGNIMEMMKKRKEAKQAAWGGVGMEGAGV